MLNNIFPLFDPFELHTSDAWLFALSDRSIANYPRVRATTYLDCVKFMSQRIQYNKEHPNG